MKITRTFILKVKKNKPQKQLEKQLELLVERYNINFSIMKSGMDGDDFVKGLTTVKIIEQ